MARLIFIAIVCCVANTIALPYQQATTKNSYSFPFVSRAEWGANPASSTINLARPVPLVVIHHTAIPGECRTRSACINSMRSMQVAHQSGNGWSDIGYNFAVGGDGAVYEGRGWTTVGAHAVSFNNRSIGIALIGNFVTRIPPANQMQVLKRLIAEGVRLGHISPSYGLIGHRQVSATECPGTAFFNELRKWDRFQATL
ncbi:unnamed protein product [Arctia plantaginis]|uniref:Peptidoglycan-recognition protein n=1 Tax=Arctia plantaginis TaxID=874455 RepID=A0A8S1ANL1_ARCPL|nr:unnamed protein product [Arctia plantaginis]